MDENVTLKLSASDNDNREFRVKDTFFKYELKNLKGDDKYTKVKDIDYYSSYPFEIDSFNFQTEFILEHLPKEYDDKIREDVVTTILEIGTTRYNSGINYWKKGVNRHSFNKLN